MKRIKKMNLDELLSNILDIEPLLHDIMLKGISEILESSYPDINYQRLVIDREYAKDNIKFLRAYLKELLVPYQVALDKIL